MHKHLVSLVILGALAIGATGCAADAQDSQDDGDAEQLGDVGQQLLAGTRLSEKEVASLVRRAGFPEYEVGRMVCTAKYESSFYTRASNRNSNGTVDRGVFQINSVHLGDAGCTRSASALYDPMTNARCAHEIWRAQGNNAWFGYQAHRYTCDHFPAP